MFVCTHAYIYHDLSIHIYLDLNQCIILQEGEEKGKNLRSRGLCLVPVSCTQHVGSENGADYWAPAYGSGF